METQELSHLTWGEFLDALNEKIDNNDVLMATRRNSENDVPELRSVSLLSLDYDKANDEVSVLMFGEDAVLTGVEKLEAEFDCDELSALEISSKDGSSCLIRFNNPIHLPRAALAA